jgi:hypothetical protein
MLFTFSAENKYVGWALNSENLLRLETGLGFEKFLQFDDYGA